MEHLEPERAQLTIRTARPLRTRLAEAAARRGVSLNSFVLNAAAREADAILEQERLMRLTDDDAKCILGLLDHPPAPNAALTRAFARREDLLGASR